MKNQFKTSIFWILVITLVLFLSIRLKPYIAPYFRNQGLQLAEKNHLNEAVFFLNVAAFLNPQDYTVHYRLGEIYFEKKVYTLALNELKASAIINPGFSKAYHLSGRLFYQIKYYDEALEHLNKALELDPLNRDIALLIEEIKKVYASEEIKRATQFYSRDNLQETKSSLQKALELSDESFFNLFVVETEEPQGKDVEEQINNLQLLSRLDPQRFIIYRMIADTLMGNHEFKRALDFYKKCISEEPNSVALRNNIAVCLFQNGQPDKAIEEYRIALSLEPNNNDIIYGLARCYENIGLEQQARFLYKLLLPFSKDMPYVYIRTAGLHLKQNNLKEARKDLETAIDLSQTLLAENKNNETARLTLDGAGKKLLDLMKITKENQEGPEGEKDP